MFLKKSPTKKIILVLVIAFHVFIISVFFSNFYFKRTNFIEGTKVEKTKKLNKLDPLFDPNMNIRIIAGHSSHQDLMVNQYNSLKCYLKGINIEILFFIAVNQHEKSKIDGENIFQTLNERCFSISKSDERVRCIIVEEKIRLTYHKDTKKKGKLHYNELHRNIYQWIFDNYVKEFNGTAMILDHDTYLYDVFNISEFIEKEKIRIASPLVTVGSLEDVLGKGVNRFFYPHPLCIILNVRALPDFMDLFDFGVIQQFENGEKKFFGGDTGASIYSYIKYYKDRGENLFNFPIQFLLPRKKNLMAALYKDGSSDRNKKILNKCSIVDVIATFNDFSQFEVSNMKAKEEMINLMIKESQFTYEKANEFMTVSWLFEYPPIVHHNSAVHQSVLKSFLGEKNAYGLYKLRWNLYKEYYQTCK